MMLFSIAFAAPTPTATSVDATTGRDEVPTLSDVEGPSVQIINGEEAERDEWPMAGGMMLSATLSFGGQEFDQSTILCSSTLIAPDVVLLAAHCLDLDALSLQLGGLDLDNEEFYFSRRPNLSAYQLGAAPQNLPNDAIRAIDSVMHPEFNIFTMQLQLAKNDDIALMFLEEPILDIPLGYLPQMETTEVDMEVDEEVVVVGWGQQIATEQGQQPPAGSYGIKHMGVSHINERNRFEFQVGAVESDVRKCHGDSGGPSFKVVDTDSAEPYRVVGVTSHAYDLSDCNEKGGVDTRVSEYLDWIDNEMRTRCADGTRSWCDIEGIVPPPTADGTLAWNVSEDLGEEDAKKACGCSSTGPSVAGWMLLGGLALLRRRHA